ncbi:head maturation protease, ClpP-related [Rhizobium leguminosarum]|uniref:ATP-dependent Clp protease proteolytic subunit n=2 Tax=Rhizobium leguminosarum TaxID=384 RepID=A0A154IIL0_RHILE|nr:head maturation protease, ClpP-related [Rhizobium leguminosarum]KZA99967.1 hypothetical protein A4A59_19520 [Rhizobium leguminosarum]
MTAIVDGNIVRLMGAVLSSEDSYQGLEGFSAADVVFALAAIPDNEGITVHLNSGGGIASEGAAIHALLRARRGRTDVVIEGIAASAASLIAMAGQKVTMSAGAVMMIHDPSGFTFGNSADHTKTIDALEALATAYARVYAEKSRKSASECRTIMKEERWFSPQEAVAAGFADAALDSGKITASAFDYRRFKHAPQHLMALATAKNWTLPKSREERKETHMTTPEKGAADAAKKAAADRLKAILRADEAVGRKDLAEHLAYDTDIEADAAINIMAKAAAKIEGDVEEEQEFRPRRANAGADGSGAPRMNAQGLNGTPLNHNPGKRDRGGTNLVANMKRRHGIKE